MNKTKMVLTLKQVVNDYRSNLSELNKLDEMFEQDENSVTDEHFKDVYDKHCSLLNQGVDIVKQLTDSDLSTAKSLFILRNDKICYLLERMN